MAERLRTLRGAAAVAAAYVLFLLFAQFGFLAQIEAAAGGGAVRPVMAAMGLAGLAASLAAGRALRRSPARDLVRPGLLAGAAVAALSPLAASAWSLGLVGAGTGAAIGVLTVAIAVDLPRLLPARTGLAAGAATGTAYLVSNLPALFEGTPAVRALVPAALCAAAAALVPRGGAVAPAAAPAPGRPGGLVRLVAVFLVLVWLDSAAFATIQDVPALKAATWGGGGRTLVQGGVHLGAALAAGAALDAGLFASLLLGTWGLFALGFAILASGAPLAGPVYAVGISVYSTALVVAPTSARAGTAAAPPLRAALLYGIAGWIGSALGVGMAQDLGRVPPAFVLLAGAALAAALARPPRIAPERVLHLFGGALALGALGVALVAARHGRGEVPGTPEERGRAVYVAEGCVSCHSQYVRPLREDDLWWGPYRPHRTGARPPLYGTRRQGPDLAQVGNRRSAFWQEVHLRDPRALTPGSRMPSYASLFEEGDSRGPDLVAYLGSRGADTAGARAEAIARWTPPAVAGDPARGAALFGPWCAPCHGPAGRGDGPLGAAVRTPGMDLAASRLSDPDLVRTIRFGRPGTSMPGHETFPDRDVADLAAHVKTLRSR